jgi:hypothetical protein
VTGLDFEKAVVALACWRSLKNEQYRGMSFGAMALRNLSAISGKSMYEESVHFLDESKGWPDAREPQFQSLLSVLDGIYSDTTPDRTGGATDWTINTDPDKSFPANSYYGERTCQVGQVTFYRRKA